MKIKVLEALAYGVPVISNAEGLEGLRFEDGRDVVRAESDAEIVEKRARCCAIPGGGGRCGRRAVRWWSATTTRRASPTS